MLFSDSFLSKIKIDRNFFASNVKRAIFSFSLTPNIAALEFQKRCRAFFHRCCKLRQLVARGGEEFCFVLHVAVTCYPALQGCCAAPWKKMFPALLDREFFKNLSPLLRRQTAMTIAPRHFCTERQMHFAGKHMWSVVEQYSLCGFEKGNTAARLDLLSEGNLKIVA